MSEFANPASGAGTQASAYTTALLAILGDRPPLDVLREMPAALRAAIAGQSPRQLAAPEASGKWSQAQVLTHLSHSELVGSYRFRLVLAQDRPTILGYDQDQWVERLYRDGAPDAALDEFTALRRANLRLFEGLAPADLQRVGLHSERGEESLGHMLRMYAGHDLVHLRQLARIRAAVA